MSALSIPVADLSNYRAMQGEAKARGLRYVGVSKSDLRESIEIAREQDSPEPVEVEPVSPEPVEVEVESAPATEPESAPAETVAPTISANTSVGSTFGSFVWYEFFSSKITPADFREVLLRADLPEVAETVSEIDETSEVRGVAGRWRTGRGKADRFKSEISHEDDHTMTIGILRREQVAAKQVGWTQIDTLVWDKAGKSWLSSGTTDAASAVRDECDDRRVFIDHSTIRPILVSLVDGLTPIRLRRAGGIWFVPNSAEATDLLPKLERMMDGIGESYLSIAEQSSDTARKSTAREVRSGLAEKVAGLRGQIEEWKSSLRNPRKDAVENVLASFVDLRDRADLYADVLSVRLDGLRSEISEMETLARAFVRDENDTKDRKRPSAGLLALLSGIVDEFDADEDGTRWVPVEALEDTGLPTAMYGEQSERYWTTNTVGVRALATLGYSLTYTMFAGDDETEAGAYLVLGSSAEKTETSEDPFAETDSAND